MDQRGGNAAKTRYITGFDGLRVLAVIGVIIYHLVPNSLPGGYLGVVIFLLLSGYLVTNQMVAKIEHHQSLGILKFYRRRLKRLYPTLITMLLLTIAWITLVQRQLLYQLKAIFLTNVTFVYNWWEVHNGQSYFDRFNGESPFTHLWTLGVEVQFYLVWPLILLALFRWIKNKHRIANLMMVMAIGSAVLMAVLYNPQNINRAYYGTDTRAFAFLLGGWLALVWPADQLKANLDQAAQRVLDGVGLVSLLIVVIFACQLPGDAGITYYGGMFLFTLVAMMLMGTIAHPGSHMNQWFSNSGFSWIGKRSYGIYVYQFPVMIFYEAQIKNIASHPFLHGMIQILIIFAISELSYRLIESPLAQYDWKMLPETIRGWYGEHRTYWQFVYGGVCALVLVIAVTGIVESPSRKPETQLQMQIQRNAILAKKHNAAIKSGKDKPVKIGSSEIAKKYQLTTAQVNQAKQFKVTMIGDSVLADAETDLQELMPQAYVSAQVGRQASAMPAIISSLKASGQLQKVVVLNIGTNGTITNTNRDNILKAIGSGHQIYWVNAHVPTRTWQQSVNNQIATTAKKNKNVHLIDWYDTSSKHPGWFYADNVHPNPTGNIQFARLVVTNLTK